jgi:hypothetical protein
MDGNLQVLGRKLGKEQTLVSHDDVLVGGLFLRVHDHA